MLINVKRFFEILDRCSKEIINCDYMKSSIKYFNYIMLELKPLRQWVICGGSAPNLNKVGTSENIGVKY